MYAFPSQLKRAHTEVISCARVKITTFAWYIATIFQTRFVRHCENRREGIWVLFYPRRAVCRRASTTVRRN
jgi:hypothetical protein